VLQRGNAFVLYYSTVVATTHSQCISTAVSASPAGPFVDDSALPIVCQLGLGGSIDPAPFVDATGTPYLSWRSIRGNGHPSTLWSQRLSPDGRSVVGDAAVPLLHADRPWEAGTVEGPTMATLGGQLYLYYSANEWTTASYAVGLARCASPLGPCTKLGTGPILAAQNGIAGPGGQSVFFDAQGNPWLAFHAWRPSAIGFPHSRMLYLRRLDLSTGTPVVMAPP
jgi:beta-xylosidase